MVTIDRGVCEILAACDEDDYALWEIAPLYNKHSASPLTPAIIAALIEQDLVCLIDLHTSEPVEDSTLTIGDFSDADPKQVRLRITQAGRNMYYSEACGRFQEEEEDEDQ